MHPAGYPNGTQQRQEQAFAALGPLNGLTFVDCHQRFKYAFVAAVCASRPGARTRTSPLADFTPACACCSYARQLSFLLLILFHRKHAIVYTCLGVCLFEACLYRWVPGLRLSVLCMRSKAWLAAPGLLAHAEVTKSTIIFFSGSQTQVPHGVCMCAHRSLLCLYEWVVYPRVYGRRLSICTKTSLNC